MIAWFSRNAPIRVKFRVLALIYLLLSGGIAALAITAALGGGLSSGIVIGGAIAGVAAIVAATFGASRLICTPYVTTVVRMEALAAGDIESPVAYTDNRDCVGRITKAMAIFRESALAARSAIPSGRWSRSWARGWASWPPAT
ncbi:hypothetical protein ACVOMT_10485 [Sphingomonas panni]